jgi:hypothetical protein
MNSRYSISKSIDVSEIEGSQPSRIPTKKTETAQAAKKDLKKSKQLKPVV